MGLVTLVLRLWFLIGGCQALLEGLYCGTNNCYDVLGVDREASKSEIGRAYRKLAVAYHPDKYKGADAKEKFLMISTAYEVLKDEEERANYDYMLDNPDLFYAHYYNYYRKRVGPKVDIRVVIATTVVVISILQYLSWWHSYNQALKYALGMPKYRMKVKDIAKERKLLPVAGKKMSKEEAKSQEEAILWSILEENLDITGGYRKPHVLEVLLFKILLSPYHLVSYLVWYASWVWRFSVKGESYGPQEEVYLTRRKMKLSLVKWEAVPEEKREEWLGKRLWEGDNYELFKEEQEEEQKAAMAENNKYKKYRRYMKNHGVGRMTFAE